MARLLVFLSLSLLLPELPFKIGALAFAQTEEEKVVKGEDDPVLILEKQSLIEIEDREEKKKKDSRTGESKSELDSGFDKSLIIDLIKTQEAKIKAKDESKVAPKKQFLVEIKSDDPEPEKKLGIEESESKKAIIKNKSRAGLKKGNLPTQKKKAIHPLAKEVNIREIEKKSVKDTALDTGETMAISAQVEPEVKEPVFRGKDELADFLEGKERSSALSLYQPKPSFPSPNTARKQSLGYISGLERLNFRNAVLVLLSLNLILATYYLIRKRKRQVGRHVPERERIKALYNQMQAGLERKSAQDMEYIDRKTKELKAILRELDDRLVRFESFDSRGGGLVSSDSSLSKKVEVRPSITKEAPASQVASNLEEPNYSLIYRLSEDGNNTRSIARQVNMSQGEVELILRLRKAKGQVNRFDI